MKKLIIMANPVKPLTGFVYEDENKLDEIIFMSENFTQEILQKAKQFSVESIEFLGPKQYANGLCKKVQLYELQENQNSKYQYKVV